MSGSGLELDVVVDFYDDLLPCHFTERTLQEMMRIFRSWGIRRVYWCGQSYASGLYEGETSPGIEEHARRTYEEIGEFIPAAAASAHAEGMEFYVEFKALPARHGKKLEVDVMPSNNSDPAAPQFLGIYLDWE